MERAHRKSSITEHSLSYSKDFKLVDVTVPKLILLKTIPKTRKVETITP